MNRFIHVLAAATLLIPGLAAAAFADPGPQFGTVKLPETYGNYYEYAVTIETKSGQPIPNPTPAINAYYTFGGMAPNTAAPPSNTEFLIPTGVTDGGKHIVLIVYMNFGTAQTNNELVLYSPDTDLKVKGMKRTRMPNPTGSLPAINLYAAKPGTYTYTYTFEPSPGAGKLPFPLPLFEAREYGRPASDWVSGRVTRRGSSLKVVFKIDIPQPGRYRIQIVSGDIWLTETSSSNSYTA